MELTAKQYEGLKTAVDRYKLGERYTCIAGFAGTGKSTLVQFIIAALDINPDNVAYIAYTGKAANVLKNKGCPHAITAHKFLYKAQPLPNGKFRYMPIVPDYNIKLVIVDEVSMLPKKMWDLLLSHPHYHVIACGDPGQLSPIPSESGEDVNNHVLDNPHVFLDQVMRQAQESEIIRLSMHVREGKTIKSFQCENKDVMILPKKKLETGMLMWADQILCATNKTRICINNQVRNLLNFDGELQIGDKVINLHNEWEILSNRNSPLTNGIIGKVTEFVTYTLPFETKRMKGVPESVNVYSGTITGDEEGEEYSGLVWDKQELDTGTSALTPPQEYKLRKSKYLVPLHFSYAYAMTVWKAQGSEFPKVLLIEESYWPKDKNERIKFLYTGITRSSEKLVVITP